MTITLNLSDTVRARTDRLACSCGRRVQPLDFTIDRSDKGASEIGLVCPRCHGDLLAITIEADDEDHD